MSKKLLIFHGAEELTRYINIHEIHPYTQSLSYTGVTQGFVNKLNIQDGSDSCFSNLGPLITLILNLSNCISDKAFIYVCLPFRKVIARGLANLWNSQSAVRLATLYGQTTAIFSFTLTTAWPKVKRRGCILPGIFLQKSEDILAYFWDTLCLIWVPV